MVSLGENLNLALSYISSMAFPIILGVLSISYMVISRYFRLHPEILYPRKSTKRQYLPVHISHRGGSAENIENTMAAFAHAVRLGTDMLELDVHLTRDGKIVVAHEASIERLTGVKGMITEFDYADLPMFKDRISVDFIKGEFCTAASVRARAEGQNQEQVEDRARDQKGARTITKSEKTPNGTISKEKRFNSNRFSNEEAKDGQAPLVASVQGLPFDLVDYNPDLARFQYDDRRYPLLEELFLAFPHVAMSIDVKQDDDRLIRAVSDLVDKYAAHERTFWGNKSNSIYEKLKAINPSIPRHASFFRVVRLCFLYQFGLLPFFPIDEGCFAIPLYSLWAYPQLGRDKPAWHKALMRFCDFALYWPNMFRHLQKRGIPVLIWVLNSEADFEFALVRGGGAMSDKPSMLKKYLNERSIDSNMPLEEFLALNKTMPQREAQARAKATAQKNVYAQEHGQGSGRIGVKTNGNANSPSSVAKVSDHSHDD